MEEDAVMPFKCIKTREKKASKRYSFKSVGYSKPSQFLGKAGDHLSHILQGIIPNMSFFKDKIRKNIPGEGVTNYKNRHGVGMFHDI